MTMLIKTATSTGYMEGNEDDGVVLNFLGRARGTVQDGKCPTIQTDGGGSSGVIKMTENGYRIRRLTERECLRLMAYTDEEIDRLMSAKNEKGKQKFPKTALYQFAGNSVVVDCFRDILSQIVADDGKNEKSRKSGQTTLFDYEG